MPCRPVQSSIHFSGQLIIFMYSSVWVPNVGRCYRGCSLHWLSDTRRSAWTEAVRPIAKPLLCVIQTHYKSDSRMNSDTRAEEGGLMSYLTAVILLGFMIKVLQCMRTEISSFSQWQFPLIYKHPTSRRWWMNWFLYKSYGRHWAETRLQASKENMLL